MLMRPWTIGSVEPGTTAVSIGNGTPQWERAGNVVTVAGSSTLLAGACGAQPQRRRPPGAGPDRSGRPGHRGHPLDRPGAEHRGAAGRARRLRRGLPDAADARRPHARRARPGHRRGAGQCGGTGRRLQPGKSHRGRRDDPAAAPRALGGGAFGVRPGDVAAALDRAGRRTRPRSTSAGCWPV